MELKMDYTLPEWLPEISIRMSRLKWVLPHVQKRMQQNSCSQVVYSPSSERTSQEVTRWIWTFSDHLTGAKRREFSGMIHFITSNVIIPATPSNPSISYVKRTSKSYPLKKKCHLQKYEKPGIPGLEQTLEIFRANSLGIFTSFLGHGKNGARGS